MTHPPLSPEHIDKPVFLAGKNLTERTDSEASELTTESLQKPYCSNSKLVCWYSRRVETSVIVWSLMRFIISMLTCEINNLECLVSVACLMMRWWCQQQQQPQQMAARAVTEWRGMKRSARPASEVRKPITRVCVCVLHAASRGGGGQHISYVVSGGYCWFRRRRRLRYGGRMYTGSVAVGCQAINAVGVRHAESDCRHLSLRLVAYIEPSMGGTSGHKDLSAPRRGVENCVLLGNDQWDTVILENVEFDSKFSGK